MYIYINLKKYIINRDKKLLGVLEGTFDPNLDSWQNYSLGVCEYTFESISQTEKLAWLGRRDKG